MIDTSDPVPAETIEDDVLDEAKFLVREYLLADDVDLAPSAIRLKRRLAETVVALVITD